MAHNQYSLQTVDRRGAAYRTVQTANSLESLAWAWGQHVSANGPRGVRILGPDGRVLLRAARRQ